MTYMYYAVLGTFVTIIVAIIVSFFTASDEDTFDENLLHPCVVKLRHWYNGASPARTDITQPNTISNVNEAFEITEEGEETRNAPLHSINSVNAGPSIMFNEIKCSKTQVPLERFKKLSVS